jgi:dCTP deaminase
MDSREHAILHNRLSTGSPARSEGQRKRPDLYSEEMRAQLSTAARRFFYDDQYTERREALRQRQIHRWASSNERMKQRERQLGCWDDDRRAEQGERSRVYWANTDDERRKQQREIARGLNPAVPITESDVLEALRTTGSIRGAARALNCDRTVFRRFAAVIEEWRAQYGAVIRWNTRTDITENMVLDALDEVDGSVTAAAGLLECSRIVLRRRFQHVVEQWQAVRRQNHRIIAIRDILGEHDVYCLTVPETHNFALEAGVFVHNCGIILNTTPFEPGWQGYVTLEISNTTPLPARIYANEGIGQVLFFESDEECESEYGAGKYQDQGKEITLPRI